MSPSDILYHITVAGKPTDLVETRRGQVTYAEWCESERRRIVEKGNWSEAERAVKIFHNAATGEISLVHLRLKSPGA